MKNSLVTCCLLLAFFNCHGLVNASGMVSQQFRYDGSYDPYSLTPPPGQSVWSKDGGGLSPNYNTPEPGHAECFDIDSGARLTMLKAHVDSAFISDPGLFEWAYDFRMNFISTSGPRSFFGVREEGGRGRQIMFSFSSINSDMFYCDRFGNIQGAKVHDNSEGNLKGDYHHYRVVKVNVDGTMKVRFYIDCVLKDERSYSSFPEDVDLNSGFGFYSSTPGTVMVIIDEMKFGPVGANANDPFFGAEDVGLDTVLKWEAPECASLSGPLTYNVYFGDNQSAVAAGDASVFKGVQSETSYDPGELSENTVYFWRVDVVDPSFGVIEGSVWRFSSIGNQTSNPDPAEGMTDVVIDQILSWTPAADFNADAGDSHSVYFGTDRALVADGDDSSLQATQAAAAYDPELDWETVYYWRIDETIDGVTLVGDVWTFTTGLPVCDPGLTADVNDDCVVDMEDFAVLAAQWLESRLYKAPKPDNRNIALGYEIPDEGYCDQPYVVVREDGTWVCVITTGPGAEGSQSQHVISTTTSDNGKTWTTPVDIEPQGPPEASWAMPLITPSGRIYVFYDYNGDDIRTFPGGSTVNRADTLGWLVYKYSDDGGMSWSDERYRIPIRQTRMDNENTFNGDVQMFWGIGKPVVNGNTTYFAFSKVGKYLVDKSEGWIFRSDNVLLEETGPGDVIWQMLPGDDNYTGYGIRSQALGDIQAEHNLVALNNDDLYVMYRTNKGFPAHAYSRDRGYSWTEPVAATYTPDGPQFKHPRACPRIWKCKNGKYLFWFHNNGTTGWTNNRNPVWISGGIEQDGFIYWSQPEILMYDLNPATRISYPDLIEQDGRYWITETQKAIARVHEIDATLLEGVWNQQTASSVADGYSLCLDAAQLGTLKKITMPWLPDMSQEGGFSIDLWVRLENLDGGQVILDQYGTKGIKLYTTDNETIELEMNDGVHTVRWDCDRDILQAGVLHHIVVTVDGGPDVITFVVDGILCDGGSDRHQGWSWFDHDFADVNTRAKLQIGPSLNGSLESLRIYPRSLRTSEAVSNYRSGLN